MVLTCPKTWHESQTCLFLTFYDGQMEQFRGKKCEHLRTIGLNIEPPTQSVLECHYCDMAWQQPIEKTSGIMNMWRTRKHPAADSSGGLESGSVATGILVYINISITNLSCLSVCMSVCVSLTKSLCNKKLTWVIYAKVKNQYFWCPSVCPSVCLSVRPETCFFNEIERF